MIKVLIGHRGVGKTALLSRLKTYFPKDQFLDLDQEIEKVSKQSISEIFAQFGEEHFRSLEIKTFQDLIGQAKLKTTWIALGAGFPLERCPFSGEKIWLRRATDPLGRIFLNRPRLEPQKSLQDEYLERYRIREEKYRTIADWDYLMPEGLVEPDGIEKQLFQEGVLPLARATLTVLPPFLEHPLVFEKFSFSQYELRDDLLSEDQIFQFFKRYPQTPQLLSLRKPKSSLEFYQRVRANMLTPPGLKFDFALEVLGETAAPQGATLVSLHQGRPGESLPDQLKRLEKVGANGLQLKFAAQIADFRELEIISQWQSKDPERRQIFPRSGSGRWSWFRQLQAQKQSLNFVQILDGSASDQPCLYQWLRDQENRSPHFAAVLGAPVFHSRSPMAHQNFFTDKGLPFYAIEVKSEEWDQALPFLQKLGLSYAAVTSPLKDKISMNNTMTMKNGSWSFANTDILALQQELKSFHAMKNVAVWGGGGTLASLRSVLPQAHFFSVRTGALRTEGVDAAPEFLPEIVIWAASPNADLPSPKWRPKIVFDLNYREDSRGKELAIRAGAQYISGENMFKLQAQAQQKIWQES